MADISLLFDVAMGGGNPSGDSEQLIRSQLEAIVNGINAKPFSIKFQADEASLQQFQKRVSEIAISLGNGAGTSSAAFEQVTRQINIAATAIHTMNGAVNASNLERISTALSGLAGANISDGAIADIVSRLESMSVVLTDARIQFEDLGKEGERVPRLIIEGIDAAGNAIRRNLRFDNKGELDRDLTDITVKLAEVERASKNTGANTGSAGDKATDAFTKAKKAVTDYYNALTQLGRSGLRNIITQDANGTWSSSQAGYEERVTQLNRLTQEYHNATTARQTFTASQQAEFTEHETARAQQYRVAVEDVARAEQQRQETLRSTVTITRSYDNTISDCQKKLKDWSAAENSRHQSSREAYDALRNEVTAAKQARIQYNNGSISIEQYTATMDRLKSTLISTKSTLQQNGDAAKTLSERISGLAKKFASWLGVSQIIMYIYRSIRKMVTAVIEPDTAMTELKKVTDETDATYDKFLRNAATRAKRLGASLTDVVKTSADFARLGLSLDDAETVSDAALVYKNVGDGIEDIDQASESLISTMQAFGIKAEDVMTIVDKFNVAGNNFAISSGGVGDALLNSASALAAANNTLDESIALITAANETIQNPEKVGTALKTLSMYIRAAKTEAEEAGISTEGMANSVSELREEILSLTGNRVDIMLDDDSFKSTYQIIKELSEVWGSLSETTKSNITELIGGGVRNANVINALMTNMGTAAEVVEKTSNSAGSALNENAIVLESIPGKINVLKAKFQELSQSIISSGFIKNIVDFGSGLLNILLNVGVLIEKLGGLNNILMITAGVIAIIKADAIVSVLSKLLAGIVSIIPAITAFTMKMIELPLAMKIAKAEGQGLAAALDLVGISASTAQIAVAALVAVLTIAIIAINSYNQKQEETRRNSIDNAKTAKQEADSLRDLIDQYKRLAEAEQWDETSRGQAKSIQEQIAKLVGTQADNLDLVNGKLDEEIKKLDEILLKTAEANTGQLLVAKKAATDNLIDSTYTDFTKTDTTIYNAAGWTAHDALQAAMKEIGLEYKYFTGEGFWVYNESADEVLQSYADMIKLQEHLVANYETEISTGGSLKAFYDNLSNRINKMRTAVDDYNQALDNYQQNEAVKEFGQYLKTNDIDSKEDFDAYINSVKNSTAYSESYKQILIDLANQTFPQYADAVADTTEVTDEATESTNKFASALSKINKLAAGLNQLDSIYADIYDKEDFDWSSILGNEDFTNAFGGLGDAYDDFIKTVANAPDDIDACQAAFDNLATAYIWNSDALEGVTDETRNATVAMLEQMGVANAASIVDARLAYNKELLRLQTILGEDATYAEIYALYQECEAGSLTAQILAQLAATKLLTNETGIQTTGDIEQLEGLAKSANATEASLLRVAQAKALMAKAEKLDSMAANWKPGAGFDNYLSYVEQAEAARKEAQELLSKPLEYNEIDFSKYKVQYSGGSATNSAKSSGSGSNKEETWFEKQLSMHQHLVAMNQETQEEYLTWLNSAYKKAYDEGIIDLNDYYKYTEEVYQGLQDLFRDYLSDVEHEISMRENYDGEAKKIIELYKGLIENVEKEIADARARGLTDEDDYIQELQKKWQDYTGSIEDLRDEITESAKDALDELIDYRVDMLKQEIEDEKDALDKRLDNLKVFYDKQKEMLQDQRDEENYLKDQSEKRKTVTDLQAELAMLANDDSAWAQKRKLELQEEITTAQEDLDEFEKDHALDLALDALDKAYNDQEAQIQAEMDALEERLNDPEALYNKALEDIRKNSENQLYYQMLMYNRQYGDGNDETVKDLWESAFGALSDYEKLFGELYKGVDLENETGVEDEGGWDDEKISGTNPDNQQPTPPPPADDTAKEETATPQLTDDIKKKVAAAIWNGGYGWGTGSTRTQRLTEVFGAGNGIQALVNKGVGRSGVSLTNEYTYANMRKKFKGYASGTDNATPGWHELFEGGLDEYIFTSSDGSRYRMFSGLGDKVLNGAATDFLYDFANSGGTVLTKMLADLLKVGGFGNITKPVQAIEIHSGDVVVQGNATERTVSEIRRAQRDNLEFVLKELNRLNK